MSATSHTGHLVSQDDGPGTRRRRVFLTNSSDLKKLRFTIPDDQSRRAAFEDRYGYPTNIDRVWAEREAQQRSRRPAHA